MEKGTLYQLKNLLNRSSIPTDPGKNMKAVEDFLHVVLTSYIIVAAKTILREEISGTGNVHSLSKIIVERFVPFLNENNHVTTHIEQGERSDIVEEKSGDTTEQMFDDGIQLYASEVLSLGLLWHCFHDSVKEGDGDRVLMIWKYLLLVFKAGKRKNYAKEAIILLLQYYYLFSERKAAQLVWDRFVNTQGRVGCNVPTDLHMEHLNKRFKTILRNLGSNVQPHSLVRASKAIGIVQSICSVFEGQLHQRRESGCHIPPNIVKDVQQIVSVLQEVDVFINDNRKYQSFTFKGGLISKINRDQVAEWILEKALKVIIQL